MNGEAVRLWYFQVQETKSLWAMPAGSEIWICGLLALLSAGNWAAWSRWRQQRTAESAALGLVMLCAVPPAVLMMKFHPYASWLAVFSIALRIGSWRGTAWLSAPFARLAGVAVLNQWSTSALAMTIMMVMGVEPSVGPDQAVACDGTPQVRALAILPGGLVVAPANLGPYIAALTPHSVLAGPYHRIDGAILETIRIFESDPDEAEQRLRTVNPRFVVYCPGLKTTGDKSASPTSLRARIDRGEVPDFLVRIPVHDTPLQVFAIKEAAPRPEKAR